MANKFKVFGLNADPSNLILPNASFEQYELGGKPGDLVKAREWNTGVRGATNFVKQFIELISKNQSGDVDATCTEEALYNYLKQGLLDYFYPVDIVIPSYSNTSPSVTVGGVWENVSSAINGDRNGNPNVPYWWRRTR